MSSSRITVVIVGYNHKPFIADALRSTFEQTCPDVKVVVTDDASTDDSQTYVTQLLSERNWSAQTLFHDVNRGVCATLNEALATVDTPYVAFMSADDWMDPRRLEKQLELLEDAGPEYAVACSDVQLVDVHGEPLPGSIVSPLALAAPWGGDGFFEALLEESLVMAPSALIRTEALRAIGGYDESLSFEDWDVWLRLARKGYRFVRSPERLVMYRQVDGSLWKTLEATDAYRLQQIQILRKHVGYSPAVDARLIPRLFHHSVALYKSGHPARTLAPLMFAQARLSRSPRAVVYAALAWGRIPWPGGRAQAVATSRTASTTR